MDIDNLTKTIIEKDVEDELVWMTVSKYALFMSYGKIGIDAKSLYEHYQFTCILQKTNNVWAADRYCRQGLDWGRDRFDKAKALLLDLNLIEITQKRDESGKFNKIYIKVKMKRLELEPVDLNRLPENPQADKTASGQTASNALTNNINALTKKRNACKSQFIKPTIQQISLYATSKGINGFNANEFFKYYEKRDWIKANNKPVLNWKNTVISWAENMDKNKKSLPELDNDLEARRIKQEEQVKELFKDRNNG